MPSSTRRMMTLLPLNGADLALVELRDDCRVGRLTPHCKVHDAMNTHHAVVSSLRASASTWSATGVARSTPVECGDTNDDQNRVGRGRRRHFAASGCAAYRVLWSHFNDTVVARVASRARVRRRYHPAPNDSPYCSAHRGSSNHIQQMKTYKCKECHQKTVVLRIPRNGGFDVYCQNCHRTSFTKREKLKK